MKLREVLQNITKKDLDHVVIMDIIKKYGQDKPFEEPMGRVYVRPFTRDFDSSVNGGCIFIDENENITGGHLSKCDSTKGQRMEVFTMPDNADRIWAEMLWESLGEIPIDDDDCILEDWNMFRAGTCRFEIWQWFEERFDLSVAEDLMHMEIPEEYQI